MSEVEQYGILKCPVIKIGGAKHISKSKHSCVNCNVT